MQNPYSSPVSDTTSGETSNGNDSHRSLGSIARVVFLAWERLRIAYIVVLGVVTLAITGTRMFEPRIFAMVGVGAVVTNLCFFAGPIVETYVRWLGCERKWVRWILFIGGTILSAIVALVALAAEFLPNQN